MSEDHIEVAESTVTNEEDIVSVAQEVKRLKSRLDFLEKGARETRRKLEEASAKLAKLSGYHRSPREDRVNRGRSRGKDEPTLEKIFAAFGKDPIKMKEVLLKVQDASPSYVYQETERLVRIGAIEKVSHGIYRRLMDRIPEFHREDDLSRKGMVLEAMGESPVSVRDIGKKVVDMRGPEIIRALRGLIGEGKVEKVFMGVYRKKA